MPSTTPSISNGLTSLCDSFSSVLSRQRRCHGIDNCSEERADRQMLPRTIAWSKRGQLPSDNCPRFQVLDLSQ